MNHWLICTWHIDVLKISLCFLHDSVIWILVNLIFSFLFDPLISACSLNLLNWYNCFWSWLLYQSVELLRSILIWCVLANRCSTQTIPVVFILLDRIVYCINTRSSSCFVRIFKNYRNLFIITSVVTWPQVIAVDFLSLESIISWLPFVQLHWLVIQSFQYKFFLSRLLVVKRQFPIEAVNSVEIVIKIFENLDLWVSYFVKIWSACFAFVRLWAF